MRRRLLIAAVLSASVASGCTTQRYVTPLPTGQYLNHPPQYFPAEDAMTDPAFPLPKEAARAQAPDRIEPIPADESKPAAIKPTPVPPTMPSGPILPTGGTAPAPAIVPTAPLTPPPPLPSSQPEPKRSMRQRIAGLFGSSKPKPASSPEPTPAAGPMPFVNNIVNAGPPPTASVPVLPEASPLSAMLLGGMSMKTGPALPTDQLPPIPNAPTTPAALPPSITKIVPPGPVAAPTPEQLNAISPDLVKAFQKDAFDPNVVPTGGKSVAPAVTELPPPSRVEAAKANALDGTTWVRENDGIRVTLKFTGKRVSAEVQQCIPDESGKPTTLTMTVAGEYNLTDDGRLYGIVTDDVELLAKPRDPVAETLTGRPEDRLDSPFAARVRITADALTIQTFRCTAAPESYFDEQPERRTAFLGKYVKCTDTSKLPALKQMKVRPAVLTPERIHGGLMRNDDLRQVESDWRSFWYNDMPSHMRPVPMRGPAMPQVPRAQPSEPASPESMPMPRGRTALPVGKPTVVAAMEFLHTILQENPAAVTAFTTEAGRGIGLWLGKKFDRPDLGGIVGGIIGSTLGAKLIEGPKPTKPTTVETVSYWLGVK